MAEYAIGRRAPFVLVPRSLIEDPNIDPHTLATYIALAYHADFGKETGAFPSDETAANLVGMNYRTVRRRREKLKEMGWLEWVSGKKHGVTNRYVVHQGSKEGGSESPRGSAGESHPGRTESPTTKEPVTKEPIPRTDLDLIWSFWEDRRALALRLNGKRKPMERSKKRLSAVKRIWKLGYSQVDFERAIRGCTSSDFHIQNNHLDIELICRDQDHFERFMACASDREQTNGPTADQTRDMVDRLYG